MLSIPRFARKKCHIAEVYGLWTDFTTLTMQSTLKKIEISLKVSRFFWKLSEIFRKHF